MTGRPPKQQSANPAEHHIRALLQLARGELATFTGLAFLTIQPGEPYLTNWHIRAISHALGEVMNGRCKRLIITMPPRSLKSIAASIAFPAFVLGHDPSKKIINVSYAQSLSVQLANGFRSIVEAPFYRHLFPDFKVSDRKNTENELQTTQGGFRMATSVGGQLTGRGADIIIIDDPMKADDVSSATTRQRIVEWMQTTLMSRLNSQREGAIVVVMQRLHVDDLAGVLLESGGWTHLNLPAIAEEDQRIPTGDGKHHHRAVGDLLHPERCGKAELDQLRRDIGSLGFSAQYQQSPAPPDGNLVKRAWFRNFDLQILNTRGMTIVQCWDTALKGDPSCDYSVCSTWARDGSKFYLLDVLRRRMAYPELLQAALKAEDDYRPEALLIEAAGSGISLSADLNHRGIATIAVNSRGDKESRLARVSAMIESGSVFLPEIAPWKDDFMMEVLSFPSGRHDDQVDSMSQALIWMKDEKPTGRFWIGKF
ncbi:phage terminase large subunit [Pseudohoeflea coraliihabitans]|uniref:Phage terminase large subunit n=1 Tax=Pseudohoeflea coraliihabitans TaxID=2860393 RepID=A0ABS6WJC3_9HYPH|nr:phage terminase large subunit [Pseudohoeflea sp. DP4N28-3]MBW3096043.1 phage terminase large subunit [Pseudohoeflea sp. DP4N28-3]